MYTKIEFGTDLKKLILEESDTIVLGQKIFDLLYEHITDVDDDVYRVAIWLNHMECGPEFSCSVEELNQIADDLIAGREVKLD